MSVHDPRARKRIPSVETVRLSSIGPPPITETTTTQNAGPSGVRVSTQRIWRPGDHLRIDFVQSGFSAEARVVYWRSFSSSKFAMGLELLSKTSSVVHEFICRGFTCACGERVTVLRYPAISVAPELLIPQVVSCKNGHARELRSDDLHKLDQWFEAERGPTPPVNNPQQT